MQKFYFRPNLDIVKERYLHNAGFEYKVPADVFNALLVVEAEDLDTAKEIRIGITDIDMWEQVDSE